MDDQQIFGPAAVSGFSAGTAPHAGHVLFPPPRCDSPRTFSCNIPLSLLLTRDRDNGIVLGMDNANSSMTREQLRERLEAARAIYYAARDAALRANRGRIDQLYDAASCEAYSRKHGYAAEYRAFIAAALAYRPGDTGYSQDAAVIAANPI